MARTVTLPRIACPWQDSDRIWLSLLSSQYDRSYDAECQDREHVCDDYPSPLSRRHLLPPRRPTTRKLNPFRRCATNPPIDGDDQRDPPQAHGSKRNPTVLPKAEPSTRRTRWLLRHPRILPDPRARRSEAERQIWRRRGDLRSTGYRLRATAIRSAKPRATSTMRRTLGASSGLKSIIAVH
jgi:hypothetical protein